MPRSRVRFDRWRALGRLLPSEVRERVFDPAFSDLVYARLTAADPEDTGLPFGVQVVGTYVGCFPMAVPKLFYREGRLTRFGRVTVWTVSVLVVAAVAVSRMASAYAEYGSAP